MNPPDTAHIQLPLPLAPGVDLPIDVEDAALDTPAVLVDLDVIDMNINRMAAYANRFGLRLRPHAKSHKSAAIAHRQIAAGAVGMCVATATEATTMLAAGVSDVVLAYPVVGSAKLDRLGRTDAGSLTLTTDSDPVTDGYAGLAARMGRRLPVLVEVDTGMHRAGGRPDAVVQLAKYVATQPSLEFVGILTHAGHAHNVADPGSIARIARSEARTMGDLRERLESAGLPPRVVSAGSTLTAPYLTADDGITEIRPGTYVYNDLRTLGAWSCTPDALAATTLTTVVSVADTRVTVDAGSKSLTMSHDDVFGFGHVQGMPEVPLARLSEEHGVLDAARAAFQFKVGERQRLLPVHVCVWMDLQPEVYGTRSGKIVERITVDAMRHSL